MPSYDDLNQIWRDIKDPGSRKYLLLIISIVCTPLVVFFVVKAQKELGEAFYSRVVITSIVLISGFALLLLLKQRRVVGILILIIGIALLVFFPNNILVKTGPTPTENANATVIPTTFSSTLTLTSNPVDESRILITPSPFIDASDSTQEIITPVAEKDNQAQSKTLELFSFENGCIPDGWLPLPFERNAVTSSPCLDMSFYNIVATNGGMNIWVENIDRQQNNAGLYFLMDQEISELSFKLSFEEVEPANGGLNTDFYFGFLTDEIKLVGKFYVFRKTTYNNEMSYVIGNMETLLQNVNLDQPRYYSKLPNNGIIKLTISLEEQGYRVFIGDEVKEAFHEQYPSGASKENMKFVIGYKVDPGGILMLDISEFELRLKQH